MDSSKLGQEKNSQNFHPATVYPMLKLLTGDAIFAQRPLMEVLKEHDFLLQMLPCMK
jgi:hypothetical protein